jgi:hypothetical protein
MRLLGPLLLCTLVPAAAFADPTVTAVDDEPTSAAVAGRATAQPARARAAVDPRLPSDTGQFRGASVAAPSPSRVDDGASVAREHAAPAHAVASSANDGELVAELAARQLAKEAKRHQRAIDLCLAAAHKRAPTAAGSLTIDFDIADRKLKSVRVTDDRVHDFDLAACVTQVARTFNFALAEAHVRWPIALR